MVDLLPDAQQEEAIAQTRAFLQERLPATRLFRASEPAAMREAAIWPELAQLGWFAISLPEESGGIGWTLAEEMLVFRELGRFLVTPVVLATALAARIAHHAGDARLLRDFAEGKARAAPLIASGAEMLAFDAGDAQWLLHWDAEGASLFSRADQGDLQQRPGMDASLTLHRLRIAAPPRHYAAAVALPIDRIGNVLCASMLVGIAEATGDMAAEHARTRLQFGRPIGEFQAIKHACADMRVRSEIAFWQAVLAALQDESDERALSQGACAKVLAADAALKNAASAIQVHGGMGFTAELGADAFLRRAHVLHHLGGDTRRQRAALLATPLL